MNHKFLGLAAVFLITAGCNCQKSKKQKTSNANQTKEIKKMSSVTRTPSGLGFEILKAGNGLKPKVGQTVTVNYTGWLDKDGQPSGKPFDSSIGRAPFSTKIGMGYVIAGWDEALLDMQIGETRRLFIPAKLGYGSRGAGAAIPPNANLIFDVELLAIK